MKGNRRGLALLLPLLLSATPAGTVIENIATYQDDEQSITSNTVSATVQEVCAATLSPSGKTQLSAIGERVAASFQLRNDGNAARTFPLTISGSGGAVDISVAIDRDGDGNPDGPAAREVRLDVGESVGLLLSLTTSSVGDNVATLRSGCEAELAATLTARASLRPPLVSKVVVGSSNAEAGQLIRYLITVSSQEKVSTQSVKASDLLSPMLEFISMEGASPEVRNGTSGTLLSWDVELPPRGRREFTVTARVRGDVADDALISNIAKASGGGGDAQSGDAPIRVFTTRLLVTKSVSSSSVDAGSQVRYTVTVTNPSASAIRNVTLADQPDSRVKINLESVEVDGKPARAELSAGALKIEIGQLQPGGSAVISYLARMPLEAGQYGNTAQAAGMGATGAVVSQVASNVASAGVSTQLKLAATGNDLVGRVYVDNDRDGRFDPGTDRPVQGARVLLAGGRSAITGPAGMYSFPDVLGIAQAVMLDQRSVAWAQATLPGRGGSSGAAALVQAIGLTRVDFPLLPRPQAMITRIPLGGGLSAELESRGGEVSITIDNRSEQKRCLTISGGHKVEVGAGLSLSRMLDLGPGERPSIAEEECP